MLNFLTTLDPITAFILFFIENLSIVLGVILIGNLLIKFSKRNSTNKITLKEYLIALLSITINSGITFLGYILWKNGLIQFNEQWSWKALPDFLILILSMDLVMYVLHLFIHRTFLYKPIHSLHHEYETPMPIDLFVLSPFEAFSFGILWLILIYFYPCNIYAVVAYLITNVVFGMLGHISVEPFPKSWIKIPIVNLICTPTFHLMHHQNKNYNFGFYTVIWDKIGKTIAPDYESTFLDNKTQFK